MDIGCKQSTSTTEQCWTNLAAFHILHTLKRVKMKSEAKAGGEVRAIYVGKRSKSKFPLLHSAVHSRSV
jgi:hypothetical protein